MAPTRSWLLFLAVYSLLIFVAMLLAVFIPKLLAPGGPLAIFERRSRKRRPYKREDFEAGEVPIGRIPPRINIQYYTFPLAFIAFDALSGFLFLWASTTSQTWTAVNTATLLSLVLALIGTFIMWKNEGVRLTPSYQRGKELPYEEVVRITPPPEGIFDPVPLDEAKEVDELERNWDNLVIKGIRSALRKMLQPIFSWALSKSPWLPHLGIMCCALEVPMAVGASRFDMERFGVIPPASPRQADFLLVNGPVTKKFARCLKIIHDQMPEPKFVIAVGECAITGGPFQGSYSVVDGANKVVPVDLYITGCPIRPEAYLDALINVYRKGKLVERIKGNRRIDEVKWSIPIVRPEG